MDDILNHVPEKWRTTIAAALLVSPYITRAYHALSSGGGLKGVFTSIWFGTSVPKDLVKRVEAVEANTATLNKP